MTEHASEEILFEFRRVGAGVRVSAVHVGANVEAAIIGPVSAGEAALKRAALQKLDYVMRLTQAGAQSFSQKRGIVI